MSDKVNLTPTPQQPANSSQKKTNIELVNQADSEFSLVPTITTRFINNTDDEFVLSLTKSSDDFYLTEERYPDKSYLSLEQSTVLQGALLGATYLYNTSSARPIRNIVNRRLDPVMSSVHNRLISPITNRLGRVSNVTSPWVGRVSTRSLESIQSMRQVLNSVPSSTLTKPISLEGLKNSLNASQIKLQSQLANIAKGNRFLRAVTTGSSATKSLVAGLLSSGAGSIRRALQVTKTGLEATRLGSKIVQGARWVKNSARAAAIGLAPESLGTSLLALVVCEGAFWAGEKYILEPTLERFDNSGQTIEFYKTYTNPDQKDPSSLRLYHYLFTDDAWGFSGQGVLINFDKEKGTITYHLKKPIEGEWHLFDSETKDQLSSLLRSELDSSDSLFQDIAINSEKSFEAAAYLASLSQIKGDCQKNIFEMMSSHLKVSSDIIKPGNSISSEQTSIYELYIELYSEALHQYYLENETKFEFDNQGDRKPINVPDYVENLNKDVINARKILQILKSSITPDRNSLIGFVTKLRAVTDQTEKMAISNDQLYGICRYIDSRILEVSNFENLTDEQKGVIFALRFFYERIGDGQVRNPELLYKPEINLNPEEKKQAIRKLVGSLINDAKNRPFDLLNDQNIINLCDYSDEFKLEVRKNPITMSEVNRDFLRFLQNLFFAEGISITEEELQEMVVDEDKTIELLQKLIINNTNRINKEYEIVVKLKYLVDNLYHEDPSQTPDFEKRLKNDIVHRILNKIENNIVLNYLDFFEGKNHSQNQATLVEEILKDLANDPLLKKFYNLENISDDEIKNKVNQAFKEILSIIEKAQIQSN